MKIDCYGGSRYKSLEEVKTTSVEGNYFHSLLKAEQYLCVYTLRPRVIVFVINIITP